MIPLPKIRASLRSLWLRSGERSQALKDAYSQRLINPATGRLCAHYTCAVCGGEFMKPDLNVHHKVECGSLKTIDDLKPFTERLFVSSDMLSVLCKSCHDKTHGKNKS